MNTIDQDDKELLETIQSESFRESFRDSNLTLRIPEDIALNEQLLHSPNQPESSNQSLYETPNLSEIHLERLASKFNNKSVQTSTMTLNKTPKQIKRDKSTQATSINRSQSLNKNKHFMIKRTPNMPKKQPQSSNPNLIRKASQGTAHFEEDSFYNILNQTTNL